MNLNNYQKYTNEINKITKLKIKEIIFDSEIHYWERNTSEFDSKIFGKEKLLFLIEDTNNNLFGGFINSKIDKYIYYEQFKLKGKRIIDSNAFLFSINNNETMKIKKEWSGFAFKLYKKEENVLFGFGNGPDISIMKKKIIEMNVFVFQNHLIIQKEKKIF